MKKQHYPQASLWHLTHNNDNVCISESTRSTCSESSTIPVHESQKPCYVRRHCNSCSSNSAQPSLQRHVRFAATPRVIPTQRQVQFATASPVVHECTYTEIPSHQLWYSERDYIRFRQSKDEMCHYFSDRPWFLNLTRAYRALRDGDVMPNGGGNDNNEYVDPQFLGLETWVVDTARHRRRETIWKGLQHWQDIALPNVRARQMRRMSLQQSRAATAWAHHVAEQVARSVQKDNHC